MAFKVRIGDVLSANTGEDLTVEFGDLQELGVYGMDIEQGASLEVTFMRIPDGIVAMLYQSILPVEVSCDRCLQKINLDLPIKTAELVYYQGTPEYLDELDHDYELIDRKHNEIDIAHFLLQAIEVARPEKVLCAEDCKGIAVG